MEKRKICTNEIKQFTHELVKDLDGSEIKEITINTGNHPNAMSIIDFEEFKNEFAKYRPEMKVLYQTSL